MTEVCYISLSTTCEHIFIIWLEVLYQCLIELQHTNQTSQANNGFLIHKNCSFMKSIKLMQKLVVTLPEVLLKRLHFSPPADSDQIQCRRFFHRVISLDKFCDLFERRGHFQFARIRARISMLENSTHSKRIQWLEVFSQWKLARKLTFSREMYGNDFFAISFFIGYLDFDKFSLNCR